MSFQDPAAIAKAVYEAVDGSLELINHANSAGVAGPGWHFECTYRVGAPAGPEYVGIFYSLSRRGTVGAGAWNYGDRGAAVRAINEMIETLIEAPSSDCGAGNVEPVRIATAAGQVDYQCPEAVTDAVHAAAGGQRRPHDIDGAWFAVGDDWYFECSYLVDDDAPEDAGISLDPWTDPGEVWGVCFFWHDFGCAQRVAAGLPSFSCCSLVGPCRLC